MLSILCITKGDDFAWPFLRELSQLASFLHAEMVYAADGVDPERFAGLGTSVFSVKSKGYLESVHDEALTACHGDYVLRIDDDERCSPAMVQWLTDQEYRAQDHWSFPRVHLWKDVHTIIVEPGYFPDLQTRLSVKEKAGGRTRLHCGSPFGGGTIAPVAIEHWTYLVKTQAQQLAIARVYESLMPGTSRMPDDQFIGPVSPKTRPYTDGYVEVINNRVRWR